MKSSGFSLIELLLALTLISVLLMLSVHWYGSGVKQRSEQWFARGAVLDIIEQRWQRRLEQQQRWQQNGF